MKIALRLAAVVAGAIGIYWLCVLPYVANQTLYRVDGRSRVAITAEPQRAVRLARGSIDELRHIQSYQKDEPAYYMLLALNLRIQQRNEEAIEAYDGALRYDQRPEIYYERGLTLLEAGRQAEAIRDLVTACRFDATLLDTLDPSIRAVVAEQVRRARV